MGLSKFERETVILMNDGDDIAEIVTHQSRIYTKLVNNPAAELVEDLTHGTTKGGRFVIPASLISFRSKSRVGADTSKARASQNRL